MSRVDHVTFERAEGFEGVVHGGDRFGIGEVLVSCSLGCSCYCDLSSGSEDDVVDTGRRVAQSVDEALEEPGTDEAVGDDVVAAGRVAGSR